MATPVTMPQLGLTMQAGMVIEWLKREGEAVKQDEDLFIVETEKSTVDVAAPASGILTKILVPVGQTVPVQTPIAVIAASDEDISGLLQRLHTEKTDSKQPSPPDTQTEAGTEAAIESTESTQPSRRILATPWAKTLAKEKGIELRTLTGSGPNGRIVARDVENAVQSHQPEVTSQTEVPPEPGEVITLNHIQRITGKRMLRSITQIPQFHVSLEINASAMLAKIAEWPEGNKPSISAFLIKGIGAALQAFPLLNGTLVSGDKVQLHPQIHIAVAVDTPTGLMTPVLRDVPKKPLEELHTELKWLATKARHGKLTPSDLEGATFTVSNLGMLGVSEFAAIINPPQLAILASGAISYRLVMTGNRIINLPFFIVTLTADHRVLNGAMAAKFLQKFKEILEE